jgi:hypothetical protein
LALTGSSRRLEELGNVVLHDLFCSKNISVIRLRRMRWAGNVARIGGEEVNVGFYWGNLRERGHLEDLGVDGLAQSRDKLWGLGSIK